MTTKRIDVGSLNFAKAKKTKPVYVFPVAVIDSTLRPFLLLKTLEGNEHLAIRETSGEDTVICMGLHSDPWIQSKKTLLKKYDFTAFHQKPGWLVFTPKPENEVRVVQIQTPGEFELKALWGEPLPEGGFRQIGNEEDYVCQNIDDPQDVWIVRKNIFESTYEFI